MLCEIEQKIDMLGEVSPSRELAAQALNSKLAKLSRFPSSKESPSQSEASVLARYNGFKRQKLVARLTSLKFELHKLEYLQHLQSTDVVSPPESSHHSSSSCSAPPTVRARQGRALTYARKHFPMFRASHTLQIQRLGKLLIRPDDWIEASALKKLWRNVEHVFSSSWFELEMLPRCDFLAER